MVPGHQRWSQCAALMVYVGPKRSIMTVRKYREGSFQLTRAQGYKGGWREGIIGEKEDPATGFSLS